MNKAYLLIGGNMGDRLAMLTRACHHIEQRCGTILRRSAVYETAAWGKTDQPSFLNQVIELSTVLAAPDLLRTVLDIEVQMGRQRLEKYGPRLMDIDILLFNSEHIEVPGLVVPHPQMSQRRFVLTPLAELAPCYLHPVHKISIQQMLDSCPDPLKVYKL